MHVTDSEAPAGADPGARSAAGTSPRRPLLVRIADRLYSRSELRFYARPTSRPVPDFTDPGFNLNQLRDLDCYQPMESWSADKKSFIAVCQRRLDAGASVYTLVHDGLLVFYGWMSAPSTSYYDEEFSLRVSYPAETVTFFDAIAHPSVRGRGLQRAHHLRQCRDLASVGIDLIHTSVYTKNAISTRNTLKIGFDHVGSIHRYDTVIGRFCRPALPTGYHAAIIPRPRQAQ